MWLTTEFRAAASEASSDGTKFRCGIAALLALELAIKISREVEAAVPSVFLKCH